MSRPWSKSMLFSPFMITCSAMYCNILFPKSPCVAVSLYDAAIIIVMYTRGLLVRSSLAVISRGITMKGICTASRSWKMDKSVSSPSKSATGSYSVEIIVRHFGGPLKEGDTNGWWRRLFCTVEPSSDGERLAGVRVDGAFIEAAGGSTLFWWLVLTMDNSPLTVSWSWAIWSERLHAYVSLVDKFCCSSRNLPYLRGLALPYWFLWSTVFA